MPNNFLFLVLDIPDEFDLHEIFVNNNLMYQILFYFFAMEILPQLLKNEYL